MKRRKFLSLMGAAAASGLLLAGCGAGSGGKGRSGQKVIRIGHVQSSTHPDHLGLVAFAEHINEKLGDKYRVEVYPSELLGSQTEMVQLTQTGAIDFVVASNAIMETFSAQYQIFNLPYLFSSVDAYHNAMDDPEVPDLLVANYEFLYGLPDEERTVFDEGFALLNEVERAAWEDAVSAAKDKAENEQHVQFLYPDTAPFQEAMAPLHGEVLASNPELQPVYDLIQEYNAEYAGVQ